MTGFLPNQKKGEKVFVTFNTNAQSGQSVAPTVNGSVFITENESTTQITAGITVTYDYLPGVVGTHLVVIDTSDAAYSVETVYIVHNTGMTVDAITPVNYAIATFELRTNSIDDIYGNGLVKGDYNWSTNTAAADPGPGIVRANNTNYSLITEIYISASTQKGLNASGFLEALQVGDLMVIADEKDTTSFFDGKVATAAVDNGDWYTVGITISDTGNSIANGKKVDVGFLFIRTNLSREQQAQMFYRLQIDGTQTAPAVDAGNQLPVTTVNAVDLNADQSGVTIGTVTNNTDMRGTDNAALASVTALEATSQTIQSRVTVILPDQNTALANVPMKMVLSSDHATPAPGLTPTLTRSIDGGTFAAKDAGTTVTETGGGVYQLDLAAPDTNGSIVVYRLSAATADDSELTIRFG